MNRRGSPSLFAVALVGLSTLVHCAARSGGGSSASPSLFSGGAAEGAFYAPNRLRLLEVRPLAADLARQRGETVVLSAYVAPPPERGDRYAIISSTGYLGEAVVTRPSDDLCKDGCAPYASAARFVGRLAEGQYIVAVGPVAWPLARARILHLDPDWIGKAGDGRWVRVLSIDADGDGEADIEQFGSASPVLSYELRVRTTTGTVVRDRWESGRIGD